MSFEEKYEVSKRKQKVGVYSAKEIIKRLRMRELSTIHKVKVDDEVMTVAKFIETYEREDLPVQKLVRQKAEEAKKQAQAEKRKSESAKKQSPKRKKDRSPSAKPSPQASKSAAPRSQQTSPTPPRRASGAAAPTSGHVHDPPKGKTSRKETQGKSSAARRPISLDSEEEEQSRLMPKPLWATLMIVLFLILAYVGTSWLNGYRLKSQIENLFERLTERGSVKIEIIDISLDGFYLIDDPRFAKVKVTRDGEPHTYDFKITGNGITSNVKLEPIKKNVPQGGL